MAFSRYRISWVLAATFFMSTVFLLYSWIDARITVDHAWREAEWRGKRIELLRGLLQETGKCSNRIEITRSIKSLYKDNNKHVIEESQNQIAIDDLILIFDGNSISKIKFIDEK